MGRVERGLYQIYDKAAVVVSQCLQIDMGTDCFIVFFLFSDKYTFSVLSKFWHFLNIIYGSSSVIVKSSCFCRFLWVGVLCSSLYFIQSVCFLKI